MIIGALFPLVQQKEAARPLIKLYLLLIVDLEWTDVFNQKCLQVNSLLLRTFIVELEILLLAQQVIKVSYFRHVVSLFNLLDHS